MTATPLIKVSCVPPAVSASTSRISTDHVVEHQVVHSTALHVRLDGHRYLVGPLARYTLDSGQLSPTARQAAADAGLSGQCRNPFRSIVVRAVEVVYALDEALRLIAEYQPPPWPCVDVPPRAGIGQWAIEAPRRLLYHRYELDTDGLIRAATIVPPTAQNQDAIEDDLRRLVSRNLHLDDAHLTALYEQGDPQLRPVHLLLRAFPAAAHRAAMTLPWAAVIGIGYELRRDDGSDRRLPHKSSAARFPGCAWCSATASRADCSTRGPACGLRWSSTRWYANPPVRWHRTAADRLSSPSRAAATHGFGIAEAAELGRVLNRLPHN